MKKSKKILAFLMSACMLFAVPAVASACKKDDDQGSQIEQPAEPSKVKDGTALSVAVGASSTVTVSEYITANGTAVSAQSSNPEVATAQLNNGVVTILGKAKGTAIIKLICGSVEVSFNLTVTEEEVTNTPAPVFENVTASLDLRLNTFTEVNLAPKSGGDKFELVYTLANSLLSGAEITGSKLKFTPAETGKYEITVAVKCTEKDNAENVYNLTFKVTVNVTESKEETVYYKVTVDGVETQVEAGELFTLPAFTGTVPAGKEFKCWKVGEEEKNAGDEITVTANVTVTSVFKNKVYTVTVDGGEPQTVEHGAAFTLPAYTGTAPEGQEFKCWKVGEDEKNAGDEITVTANVTVTSVFKTKEYTVTIDGVSQTVAHGGKITLPEYDKTVDDGKQFMGWTDGTNEYTAGSDVIVTGNLTITAVIEDIPDTPPELVKESGSVELVLDSERDSETIAISDYVTANGYAVRVENSDHEVVTVDSTFVNSVLTEITVSAEAFGSSTVSILCGNLTVTITVTVKYPPSEVKEEEVTDNEIHDLFAGELVLDLADNITYNAQVNGYQVNGEDVAGSKFTVTGDFTQEAQEITFTVTALFEDADPLEYVYKVTVKDTTAYRIINGSFDIWENGKPVGWTVTDGYGSEQTAPTYWDNPERDFDNIGSYFGELEESKTGTLQTNTFIVGNSGWVSFQLGSAHHDAAIWVEIFDVTQNKLIAKFKNVNWSDPENAQRLIPYKVDLSDYIGDSVYIKIVDEESNGSMGFKTFFADSFNSWHDEEPIKITVDNGEVREFVNLGSPVFEGLTASVDLKDGNEVQVTLPEAVYGVIESDYTFTTETDGATISEDGTKLIFTASKSGVYEITVTGQTKFGSSEFKVTVTVTNTKDRPEVGDMDLGQINIDDDGELSVNETLPVGNDNFDLSYEIKTAVEGASIDGNEFTFTAPEGQRKGTVEVTLVVTFTDKVYAQDTYTKEITLSIEIVGNEPTINEDIVTVECDLDGNDSVEVELDLGKNVTIPASVAVTYTVEGAEGTVEGNIYTATLSGGTYNLTVKVLYGEGAELEYAYVVKVAQYSVVNGSFETGDLTGWELSGEIGAVTADKGYWNGGDPDSTANEYRKDGEYLFSWWSWDSEADEGKGAEVNREGNMGTLTSSVFRLNAGKYVSFRFGGGNRNVFIELVNAESGSIIAVFRNDEMENNGKLISYSYKVDELSADTLCYFRIVDNAVAEWGCFAVDDFRVNLDSAPDGSITAVNYISEYRSIVNGSFESGLDGWTVILTAEDLPLGGVVNREEDGEDWYQTNEGVKDGENLFTFYDNGVNKEGGKGIIRSSAFILEKNGIISFRLGAAHNSEVYINVYATDGRLLATFRNNAWEQATVMVQYYYQFDNSEEISCYFEVVDNATTDYGCIVMDDFRVNLESVPEGAVLGSAQTKADREATENQD